MNLEEAVARACQRVPGMVCGALVLLPDATPIAVVGNALDLEPLIRSAARCLADADTGVLERWPTRPFVEYLFALDDQLVVIEGGRREPRLALAIACTREHNAGVALTAARRAMIDLEASIDLSALGL